MKRVIFFILVFVLIVPAICGYAQDRLIKERIELSPGVEAIKIGGAEIIVPKGATVTEKDGMIIVEDLGQYMGRRFESIESHLLQVDTRQEDLQKEMKQLKMESILQVETNQEALRHELEKLKEERLVQVETNQEALRHELEKLKEERLAQLNTQQEDLRRQVEQLKGERLQQIEIKQEEIEKNLKRLREDFRKELKQLKKAVNILSSTSKGGRNP